MLDKNSINMENHGYFNITVLMAMLFCQLLMSKHQSRVGNSLLKTVVRVENCPLLGVISHPNRQILGHCQCLSFGIMLTIDEIHRLKSRQLCSFV